MVPEGYKPSKPVVIISSVILFSFLLFTIYSLSKRYIALSGDVRYTVGITTKKYLTASGRDLEYIYKISDSTYVGIATYSYNSKVPGGKYWVKYSVEYPDVSRIYQNMPIPACIDTLPPNGFRSRYSCNQFLKWREWAKNKAAK